MGKLFMVATPIGNLEDLTFRAKRILEESDLILAEDTRHTRILLNHYEIKTPLSSYHHHSTDAKTEEMIRLLSEGKDIALVTDAGTPGISDPGGKIVAAARGAGIEVVAIPGPSALTAFLSIAGIPSDNFTFLGFLPKKKGRQTLFAKMSEMEKPIVFFVSPYNLGSTLKDLQLTMPFCTVTAGKELTKKFEKVLVGTPEELLAELKTTPAKGEWVLAISES